MKRRIALVLAILITFLSWPAGVPSAHAAVYRRPDRPSVSCYAAALMEWQTGALLYDKNAFTRMHPASITKMMTALLALEHGRLEDLVTVSAEAASQPGSSMYLKTGDVFSLENLLYGLMLNSGNDAAWAIAEHVGGTAERFFDMMNERAREIGALNTRFRNPHGLTDPNHYTTAFDLALIARTCLKHPFFKRLVATKEKDVIDAEGDTKISLGNTNRLLWLYLGADGVKTGTTESAGQCLVASATRGDTRLLSVVLASHDRWSDSTALLDYGFNNFRVASLAKAGETLLEVPCKGAMRDKVAVVPKTDLLACVPIFASGLDLRFDLPDKVVAPCRRGTVIGRAYVYLGSDVVGRAELMTGAYVSSKTPASLAVRAASWLTKSLVRLRVF
ncbi:MAG: D-alanyl-D-alanine carboxypeptidase family protein [Bacillota bacterium]|jgi:D-alanyl-D-alanine carboxypeptidase (penicillin-binding protein 5/6)